VLIRASESGLVEDSVANVSQIVTIDKGHLDGRVGAVSEGSMPRVEAGLRLVLGL
jgi:mRNA interferase MazF